MALGVRTSKFGKVPVEVCFATERRIPASKRTRVDARALNTRRADNGSYIASSNLCAYRTRRHAQSHQDGRYGPEKKAAERQKHAALGSWCHPIRAIWPCSKPHSH